MGFFEALWSYITEGSLQQVLQWWLVLFGIGVAFFPICSRLFRRFFDKGYAFSKVLGMISAVYLSWLAISLGIAPFSTLTCMIAVIAITVAGAATVTWTEYRKTVHTLLRVLLFEEALFLGALVLWGFIRSLHPDIHGVEKFMDYGFISAILNSRHLPPPDPWFSGFSINYYYFGHFTYAWLTRLSGMYAPVVYNLSIATLFAFSFSLVHALAANMMYLRRDCTRTMCHAAGIISALLYSFGGNLVTATFGFLLPVLKLLGLYHGKLFISYMHSTRFVGHFPPTSDKLITEFPSYSFVVADLHAHVMSIPLVLTLLGLCLLYIHTAFDGHGTPGGAKRNGNMAVFLLMTVVLAATSLTNAWTLPIGALIICATAGMARYLETRKPVQGAIAFSIAGLAIILGITVLTMPFQMHFKNFSQGICLSDAHTPLWQMFVLWGYQVVMAAWFFGALFMHTKGSAEGLTASDYAAMVFFSCALVLIAIPEFIYFKDIYGYDFRRANTVFKFSYEAFTLLTVPIGYYAVLIGGRLTASSRRVTIVAFMIMLLYLPMTYTWLALMQGCKLPEKPRMLTIDGLAYMASAHPGDFKAAKWLRENTPPDAVILEAEGDSYTDYARISMMSGHQTVLGWFVHEWLWRNDNSAVEMRRRDIRNIYEAKRAAEALPLLQKYHIRYLVIGDLELRRYPGINLPVLTRLGRTAFRSEGTTILRITCNEKE
jgi:uncharacterized membrane protein